MEKKGSNARQTRGAYTESQRAGQGPIGVQAHARSRTRFNTVTLARLHFILLVAGAPKTSQSLALACAVTVRQYLSCNVRLQ